MPCFTFVAFVTFATFVASVAFTLAIANITTSKTSFKDQPSFVVVVNWPSLGFTSYLAFLQIVVRFIMQTFTVGTFVVVVIVVGLKQIVIAFSFGGSLHRNWLFVKHLHQQQRQLVRQHQSCLHQQLGPILALVWLQIYLQQFSQHLLFAPLQLIKLELPILKAGRHVLFHSWKQHPLVQTRLLSKVTFGPLKPLGFELKQGHYHIDQWLIQLSLQEVHIINIGCPLQKYRLSWFQLKLIQLQLSTLLEQL